MLRFLIAETLDAATKDNSIVNLCVGSINKRSLFSLQFDFINLKSTSIS